MLVNAQLPCQLPAQRCDCRLHHLAAAQRFMRIAILPQAPRVLRIRAQESPEACIAIKDKQCGGAIIEQGGQEAV